MWGIIPAAGLGSRIQPLAFSKELLPVGSRRDGAAGQERPRAVSEYLVERLVLAGATKLCFVIAPGKSDILNYYGAAYGPASIVYVVQPRAGGLCDAVFRAAPLIDPAEEVAVGLPDTIWFPESGLVAISGRELCFLLFPVDHPEFFDAVVTDDRGRVVEIQVKRPGATSRWIWGAFRMGGEVFHDLHRLWLERDRQDEYFGTLVNASIARGRVARALPAGESYVDVGTMNGYREAVRLLASRPAPPETPAPGRSAEPAAARPDAAPASPAAGRPMPTAWKPA